MIGPKKSLGTLKDKKIFTQKVAMTAVSQGGKTLKEPISQKQRNFLTNQPILMIFMPKFIICQKSWGL